MTLSAIGPAAVVLNIIMGKFILKEKVGWLSWLACALLVIGSVLGIVYSSYEKREFDIIEIEHMMLSPFALVLVIGEYALLVVCVLLSNKIVKIKIKSHSETPLLPHANGINTSDDVD